MEEMGEMLNTGRDTPGTVKITPDMTFGDLEKIPQLAQAGPYLIGGDGQYYHMAKDLPLSEGHGVLGWNFESMRDGIEYLMERAEKGKYLYTVYTEEEIRETPAKKDVNIMHFPAQDREKAKRRPYIIDCPGGAYLNVCSIAEGYPIAQIFNRMGYDVFVVNYRVNEKNIMPKPLDDLAACIRYVMAHHAGFDIADPKRYIVGGFSAGGNLTALWGTKNLGYPVYSLPRPEAMFPIYPVSDLHLFDGITDQELVDAFMDTLFGADRSEERIKEYSVLEQMDPDYPPCYISCCRDDETVPCSNSEKMYEKMQELGIPSVLDEGDHGGHGFGDGRFADTKGWMERAVKFFEKIGEKQV